MKSVPDAFFIPQLAFPHNHYLPAIPAKLPEVSLVPEPIRLKLRQPEFKAGLWKSRQFAAHGRVAVPKTTMNEDNLSMLPQNNIGAPR